MSNWGWRISIPGALFTTMMSYLQSYYLVVFGFYIALGYFQKRFFEVKIKNWFWEELGKGGMKIKKLEFHLGKILKLWYNITD